MSRQTFNSILLVCLLAMACTALCGCLGAFFQPVTWPDIHSEDVNTVPMANVPRVIIIEKQSDSNAPSSSPAVDSDVQGTSDSFYAAMGNMLAGDSAPMKEVWSHQPDITYMGPSGAMQVGWPTVSSSFDQQAQAKSSERVSAGELIVTMRGDLAYTGCTEKWETVNEEGKTMTSYRHAGNIFRKEAGQWKIIHHHSQPMTALKEVEAKPQTQTAPPAETPAEPNQSAVEAPAAQPAEAPAAPAETAPEQPKIDMSK